VKSHSNRRAPSLFVAAMLASLAAGAASVEVTVTDARGARIADAVVWAMPKAAAPQRPRREAAVEQRDQRFSPLVTVVQTGTKVRFPNRDPVRHQVYSFSAAKPFEIKLYAGTAAPPILFDKAGEVVLGCNIHDDMLGYVYVVDTPWFAKTNLITPSQKMLPPQYHEFDSCLPRCMRWSSRRASKWPWLRISL
jgi:plastocyanin